MVFSSVIVVFIFIVGTVLGLVIGTMLAMSKSKGIENNLTKMEERSINLQSQIRDLLGANDILHRDNMNLSKQNSILDEREKNLMAMKENFHKEFENISRKIIEDNRNKFNAESTINLKSLLDPMRENINEFKKKIEENHSKEALDRNTLKLQIENIIQTNQQLNLQAENLTKALKGDNKMQGNWGEMQLEVLLEASGLIKGIDYITQGSGLNLRDEENKNQQPDVIINLPENKNIIIDSKVSLVAYEQYCSTENESEKAIHLKNFITSIKNQVNDLSNKSYHNNEKLASPDYTIMFMPLEAAYILAISSDSRLHVEAWNKKIILVSPNALFAILKTVAHVISLEKRNKNSEEIARQGGAMYDKFVGFTNTLEKVGESIDKAKSSYDNAVKLLSTGKGNLVSRAEKLQELGAKTKNILSITSESLPEEDDNE